MCKLCMAIIYLFNFSTKLCSFTDCGVLSLTVEIYYPISVSSAASVVLFTDITVIYLADPLISTIDKNIHNNCFMRCD